MDIRQTGLHHTVEIPRYHNRCFGGKHATDQPSSFLMHCLCHRHDLRALFGKNNPIKRFNGFVKIERETLLTGINGNLGYFAQSLEVIVLLYKYHTLFSNGRPSPIRD